MGVQGHPSGFPGSAVPAPCADSVAALSCPHPLRCPHAGWDILISGGIPPLRAVRAALRLPWLRRPGILRMLASLVITTPAGAPSALFVIGRGRFIRVVVNDQLQPAWQLPHPLADRSKTLLGRFDAQILAGRAEALLRESGFCAETDGFSLIHGTVPE